MAGQVNEATLYRCGLCDEWNIRPCQRKGHEGSVDSPHPTVAVLNLLERAVSLLSILAYK